MVILRDFYGLVIFILKTDNLIYRFTRILFGLTCSPFILNGTLKHQFKKFLQENIYPKVFIEKLLRDLYVDDLLSSFNDANIAYEFYQAAKEILQRGGFHLCKWASNCKELQDKIITDSNVNPTTASNIRKVLGINIHVNQHVFSHQTNYKDIVLHGFCDAPNEAYAAVVYLQIVNNNGTDTNLLTAKSKIVPNKNLSILRIELLSCLLLSKLVTSVKDSLKSEVCRTFCWSDSQVALWWIKQVSQVWKVWFSNRVCMIRENVPVECWKFVSDGDNSSDLATRTNTSLANLCGEKWLHGTSFLQLRESE